MYFYNFDTFLVLVAFFVLFISFVYLTALPNCDRCAASVLFFPVFGIAYSLFAVSFWPCVRYSVAKEAATIAYALSYSGRALFNCIFPIVVGRVADYTKDTYGGYYWAAFTIMILAFVGIIAATIVFIVDYKGCRILYGPD